MSNSQPTGVAVVFTAEDIPKGGENIGGGFFGFEPLFAGEVTRFAGDFVAFVVPSLSCL